MNEGAPVTDDRNAQLAEQAHDDAAAEEAYNNTSPLFGMTDHALGEDVLHHRNVIANIQRELDSRLHEVQRRIEATGGTSLPDDEIEMKLEPGSVSYDYDVLIALREALPPAEWAKVHKDSYEKMQKVPARFDGTQIRRVRRAYGGDVERIAASAETPGHVRIVVERK